MTLYRVFDAATPPATALPGCQGAAGYIGASGQTPHVWTPDEWRRFAGLRQFPIWVPNLGMPACTEGEAAASAARMLGWQPGHPMFRRVIVFDFETAAGPADALWWEEAAVCIGSAGYTGVAYGSLSTVVSLAASYVWAAAWDGSAVLEPGQTMVAHQYQAGGSADFSVFSSWMMNRGGVGPRHG